MKCYIAPTKFAFSLFLAFISLTLFAENLKKVPQSPKAAVEQLSEQTLWNKDESYPKFISFKKSQSMSKSSFETWFLTHFNPHPSSSFKMVSSETDELNLKHDKYHFFIRNYKVEGLEFKTHYDRAAMISSFSGELYKIKNLKTEIKITTEVAHKKAILEVLKNVTKQNFNDIIKNSSPIFEFVIIAKDNKSESGDFRLCYKFDIHFEEPLLRENVYVDASTNEIIFRVNRICHIDQNGTAHTKYSGVQTIKTTNTLAGYILNETGRKIQTYNMQNSVNYDKAVDFFDNDNVWNNVNTAQDEVATDAHFGAEKTYDFYKNSFNRNSFDNNGAKINSYVHFGYNYNNAFWNGSVMTYGDGDGSYFTPLVSPDVVGHEITHAVTERSASLVYANESGALNESFSDIFGKCVEIYAIPTTTSWLIGDKITPDGLGIRSMANPNVHNNPDTYNGTFWVDGGGVHSNSGVQNHWFYLLVNGGAGVNDLGNAYQVTGINIQKAAAIAYRNLNVYLSANATYADARFYAIKAAEDLYGACSPEAIATANAWFAVGVGPAPSFETKALFTASRTYSCDIPAVVTFTNQSMNANSYRWDFGDGTTSNLANPTKTYSSIGAFTIRLTASGSALCGSGSDIIVKNNFFVVDNIGSPITPSCMPQTSFSSTLNGISRFILNTIDNTSASSVEGYKDFSCSYRTNLAEGKKFNYEIHVPKDLHKIKMWIDYDRNGTFSASELISESTTTGVFKNSFIVKTITNNNLPVRLRVGAVSVYENELDGCSSVSLGQYEDYSLLISDFVSTLPSADFIASSRSALPGNKIIFSDFSENLPSSWLWSFPGGNPSTATTQNVTVTYANLGTYSVSLKATNAFGEDTELKQDYIEVANIFNMCETQFVNAPNGYIYDSGGKTGTYKDNESCTLLITPPCNDKVVLKFISFNTEYGYDFLRIYAGSTTSAPLIFDKSGSANPDSLVLTSKSVLLQFQSDYIVKNSGFEIQYYTKTVSTIPSLNFSISNTNPPLNYSTQMISSGSDILRNTIWNTSDGQQKNGSVVGFSFSVSGVKSISLTGNNCFGFNTSIKTLTVQPAGSISIAPLTISSTVASGDSVINNLNVAATGASAIGYEVVLSSKKIDTTSIIKYTTYNAITIHNFRNLSPFVTGIFVKVKINGDFDQTSEYASVYFNGILIEDIFDNDVTNGTNIIKTYKISPAILQTIIQSGILEVKIQNSYEVDPNLGGLDIHEVNIQTQNESDWVKKGNPNKGIINGGQNIQVPIIFNAFKKSKGVYTAFFTLKNTDVTKYNTTIACVMTVGGNPSADFTTPSNVVLTNNQVYFYDASVNTPTSWNWTFVGANPTTSTQANPSVSYTAPGVYAVRLVVSNNDGSNTITKNGFITVVGISVLAMSPNPTNASSTVVISGTGLNNINNAIFNDSFGSQSNAYVSSSSDSRLEIYLYDAMTGNLTLSGAFGKIITPVLTINTIRPFVTRLNPSSTLPMTNISIVGGSFTGVNRILYNTLNGIASTSNFSNFTNYLYFYVQAGAITGNLTLSGGFGHVTTPLLTVINTFPTITGLFPSTISGGGRYITLTGTALNTIQSVLVQTTDPYPYNCYFSNYSNYLQIYVPNHINSGNLTVTGTFGSMQAPYLTVFVNTPTVTSITPNPTLENTYVDIYGTALNNVYEIFYRNKTGGVNSSYPYVISESNIEFYVPISANTGPLTLSGTFGKVVTPVLTITVSKLPFSCMPNAVDNGNLTLTTTPSSVNVTAGAGYFWTFTGISGKTYQFSNCGTINNTSLRLYDSFGSLITSNNGYGVLCNTNAASLRWTCNQTGTFYLLLTQPFCGNLIQNETLYYNIYQTQPPIVTHFNPNPSSGNGNDVVVKGSNLDVVNYVKVPTSTGSSTLNIYSKSYGEFYFYTANNQITGPLTLTSSFGSTITPILTITSPYVSSINPTTTSPFKLVTINGMFLNFINSISYFDRYGNYSNINSFTKTSNYIVFEVPSDMVTGTFQLSGNNFSITTPLLTIQTLKPTITGFSLNPAYKNTLITAFGNEIGGTEYFYYRANNGNILQFYPAFSNTSFEFYIPSDFVTGALTLTGSFGKAITPVLTVIPSKIDFSCMPNAVDMGNLQLTTSQNSTILPSGSGYFWTFTGIANEVYSFDVCNQSSNTYLRLYSENGMIIDDNYGDNSCSLLYPTLEYTPASNGRIYVLLSDYFCDNLSQNTTLLYSKQLPGLPVITNMSQNPNIVGNTLFMTGTGFNFIDYVTFKSSNGNLLIYPNIENDRLLNVLIPSNAITGAVTLTGVFGSGVSPVLTITTPIINTIFPNPSSANAFVTLSGQFLNQFSLFFYNTLNSGVQYTYNFTSNQNNITLQLPSNIVSGSLTFVGFDEGVVSPFLTITAIPASISSINPNPAQRGNLIYIYGNGLANINSIIYKNVNNGSSNAILNYVSNSYVSFTLPNDAVSGFITLVGYNTRLASSMVLTVNVSSTSFMCMQNPVNNGNLNIATIQQNLSLNSGNGYYWTFAGVNNTSYGFSNCGGGSDTYLRIYNSTGSLINSVDDSGPFCSGSSSSMVFNCNTDGIYYLLFTNYSCDALTYNQTLYYSKTISGSNPPATITTINPNPALRGNTISIYGDGLLSYSFVNYQSNAGLIRTANLSLSSNTYCYFTLPTDAITGKITLTGTNFNLISSMVLTVNVSSASFMCMQNPVNNGNLNITTIQQNLSLNSGNGYYWTFAGVNNTSYGFSNCGGGSDTYLRIYNSTGSLINSVDDSGPFCSGSSSSMVFNCNTDGIYYLLFTNYSCDALTYNQTLYYSKTISGSNPNPPATITSINPNPALRGNTINIYGDGLLGYSFVNYQSNAGLIRTANLSLSSNTYCYFTLPTDAITGKITLIGTNFNLISSMVLTVNVSSTSFMCMQNPVNNGNLNITTIQQNVSLNSGNGYYWTFAGVNNTSYGFSNCGGGSDTYLRIYNSTGSLINSVDDSGPFCSGSSSSMVFNCNTDGIYYLLFTNYSCDALTYNQTLYYSKTISGSNPNPPATITSINPNPALRGNTINIYGDGLLGYSFVNYQSNAGLIRTANLSLSSNTYGYFTLPTDAITGKITLIGTNFNLISSMVLTVNVSSTSFMCMQNPVNNGNLNITTIQQNLSLNSGNGYYWTFSGVNGFDYGFSNCGNNGDTYLRIYDSKGLIVKSNDDNGDYCNTTSASMIWSCNKNDIYYLLFTNAFCNTLSNYQNLTYSSTFTGITTTPSPLITHISPNPALLNQSLTIFGNNLAATQFISYFNNNSNISNITPRYISNSIIVFDLPADAISGYLTIVGNNYSTLSPSLMISNTSNSIPYVDFSAQNVSLSIGQYLNLEDKSLNSPTSWYWEIFGPQNFESYAKNPSILLTLSGVYSIKLSVSNLAGNASLFKPGYISVGTTTGIVKNISSSVSYLIYPNPAETEVFVRIFDVHQKLELKLFNSLGKCISTQSTPVLTEENLYKIDIQELPSGFYLIEFLVNNHLNHSKFLKK